MEQLPSKHESKKRGKTTKMIKTYIFDNKSPVFIFELMRSRIFK